jgi:hypothetical protein
MTAIPKSEPHAKVVARAKREHAKARAICRAVVYGRANGRCEVCGRALILHPADAPSVFMLAHIHERKHRSQGGDDTDPNNAACLCWRHHQEAHHLKPRQRPCGAF